MSTEDAVKRLTPKQFRDLVKELSHTDLQIRKMERLMYKLPQGKALLLKNPLSDGTVELTQTEFKNRYVLPYRRKLDVLPRYYNAAYKYKKKPNNSRYSGFNQAAFFTSDMQSFVKEFFNQNSKELNALVPDFTKSFPLLLDSDSAISSSSILCSLLNIYIKVRKLVSLASMNKGKPEDQFNDSYLGADQLMRKYLGKTFEAINRTDKELDAKVGPKVDKRPKTKGEVIKPLDTDNFGYSAFQSLVSLHKRNLEGQTTRRRKVVNPETGRNEEVHSSPIPIAGKLTAQEQAYLAKPFKDDPLAEEKEGIYSALRAEQDKVTELLEKLIGRTKKKKQIDDADDTEEEEEEGAPEDDE